MDSAEEDYEVITSEEVDRVLDALDQIISSVSSENIRVCLEDAADSIFSLVYQDESEEQSEAA